MVQPQADAKQVVIGSPFNAVGVSSQSRGIAHRVTRSKGDIARIEKFIHRTAQGQWRLQTELNREIAAKSVRFESTWRNHGKLKFRFYKLEKTAFDNLKIL